MATNRLAIPWDIVKTRVTSTDREVLVPPIPGRGPLIPLAIVFLHETFPPQQRGLAQSLYLVGDAVGAVVGRGVVGYFIDHLGWRVVFYINVPFGLIALGLLFAFMPNRREAQQQAIDPLGILLLGTFVVCLLIGLNHGSRYGWDRSSVQTLLLVGSAALVAFVITECLVQAPLMDLRLFRTRAYSLGLMGGFFLAPLMLQRVQGFTPLHTGLLLMPGAIAWGISWAVGIALLSLVIEARLDHHMQRLDQDQSLASQEVEPALQHLQGQFTQQGDSDTEAGDKALLALHEQLRLHATVTVYQECFLGLALLYAFFLPLLGLGRRYAMPVDPSAAHATA